MARNVRRTPARRMPPPPPDSPQEAPPPPPREQAPGDTATLGSLVIQVQPSDADVLIDGERWRGPQGEERLVVQLSEGQHKIEVQKDGFQTYSGSIDVHGGQTTPLNVSLPRRD
jgi:hypothetical protein